MEKNNVKKEAEEKKVKSQSQKEVKEYRKTVKKTEKKMKPEKKEPKLQGRLVRTFDSLVGGAEVEIEVIFSDGRKVTLYDSIVEHCAKDLTNNEVKKVWKDCKEQIKAIDPNDIPFTFYELMKDLYTAIVNRGIDVGETHFVAPAKIKKLLGKEEDGELENEEIVEIPNWLFQPEIA